MSDNDLTEEYELDFAREEGLWEREAYTFACGHVQIYEGLPDWDGPDTTEPCWECRGATADDPFAA